MEMTVSTLAEIETCPRRWALASAEYPDLWAGRGYPPRVHLGSLAGSVVHLVLETITRELGREGCPTIQDPMAVQIMKRLGGYTKVLQDCTERVIARFRENPRAARFLDTAARSLRAKAPELRTRVQTLLSGLRLPLVAPRPGAAGMKPRSKLSTGAHPEVELRAKAIGWKGKADLLVLSEEICEIVDFKTGEQVDHHRFQVRVYALLWSLDHELNPERRLAKKLTLAYMLGNVDVEAPSPPQLEALERELVVRRDAASQAAAARPPEAHPTASNCRLCGVRQLCDAYWSPQVQRELSIERATEGSSFVDVEISILGRHGPSSWDAEVVTSCSVPKGSRVLLRSSQAELAPTAGERLRVLDAHLALVENDPIVTMGAMSEVYKGT
jgi:CRISPR/Cas system-associated exonuclease Cas4 (RecB family)